MKPLHSIAAIAIGATLTLFGIAPVKSEPIDCPALAKKFEIGETNFNENLRCKEGSLVIKYGEWCQRTQGVVCTVGRGWY